MARSGWKFYYSDDGETIDDAHLIPVDCLDHDDAAHEACALDFKRHDGWERGETPFKITVVSPYGEESVFRAWHEPSVVHCVEGGD